MNSVSIKDTPKVALLHDGGPISGISSVVYNIFTNLKSHGIVVNLYQHLQWEPETELPSGTIVVNKSQPMKKHNSDALRKITSAINLFSGSNWHEFKNVNADISILSNPSLLKLTKYLSNCGVIGHDLYFLHDNDDSKILNIYFKKQYKFFNEAKFILSNSEFTRKEFMSMLDISPDKITTIYPYFNSALFHPGKSDFRDRLKLNDGEKIILSVGSEQPNKNIDTIIKLMTKLPKNYKLVRIGRNTATLRLIQELNLENRIILMENLPEKKLADVYRGSDILVFPSLFEGFGIPVVEAMASGLSVLVSDRGSLPEVVGDVGIISDPFDIDFMAEHIQRVLEDEKATALSSQMSIMRAKSFTMEAQYKQLLGALKIFQ